MASVGREPVTAEDCGSDCGGGVSNWGANTYGVLVHPNTNPQNAVTDFVEICLLQGLRSYEIRRAVIIRSIGRPKIVCVRTALAQLRGERYS